MKFLSFCFASDNELEKELKNIYETLTEDVKKKEAFRKNLLNWVKKYMKYLKNREKKVSKSINIAS